MIDWKAKDWIQWSIVMLLTTVVEAFILAQLLKAYDLGLGWSILAFIFCYISLQGVTQWFVWRKNA